jgi:hypothetical protein
MNQRIKELAEQSFDITKDNRDRVEYSADSYGIEKFAELIVRECIGVVEGGRFLHDQAPTALFAKECSSAIKRHFGVER